MESRFLYAKHTTESWLCYQSFFTPHLSLYTTKSWFHCIHIQRNHDFVVFFSTPNITMESWLRCYILGYPLTKWNYDSVVNNFFNTTKSWFHWDKKYPQQYLDYVVMSFEKKKKKHIWVKLNYVFFYWTLKRYIYWLSQRLFIFPKHIDWTPLFPRNI